MEVVMQMQRARCRSMVVLGLWLTCLGLVLLNPSLALSAEPSSSIDRLRIVTFNAQCLAAPNTKASRIPRFRWDLARVDHLERVANVIETLEPDILNLLEVTSSDAVAALVKLLHAKGLSKYRGFHVESNDKFTGFDVALITCHEPDNVDGELIRCLVSPTGDMTWRERYQYTDADGKTHDKQTTLARHAVYGFTFGEVRLGFLGLHLKADPSDARSNSRRSSETKIARRMIQQEIVDRGYLPIVLGDLNDYDPDVPDRDQMRVTKTTVLVDLKNYDPSTPEAELVNPADRIVRLEDRYTSHWDRNENGIADSMDVYTMIDYILLPKPLVPAIKRVFVSRCFGLATSDHWPVVVDLDLSP